MAEIELAGAKIRGGRLLLIIPILSALAGGLWGAFEFYKDYSNMKDKIETYVAPDMSGFDKNLAVLDEDMVLIKEEFKLYKEMIGDLKQTIGDMKSDVHDIRIELRDDIANTTNNDNIKHNNKFKNYGQLKFLLYKKKCIASYH